MECPNCYREIKTSSSTCPACGTSLKNIKSKDHAMLLELRRNLISRAQLQKTLASAKKQLNTLEETSDKIDTDDYLLHIPDPDLWTETEAMEAAYIKKCKEENKPREERQQRRADRREAIAKTFMKFLRIVLILAAIIVPIIGIIHAYDYQRLGFTFFVEHQWEGLLFKDWSGTIGLCTYIAGAVIAVGLIALLISRITDEYSRLHSFSFSVSIGVFILIVIAFLVSGFALIKIWWGVRGGWWVIAWIPAICASFILPIVLIARLAFAILIATILLLLVLILPALVKLFCDRYDDIEFFVADAVSQHHTEEIDLYPLETSKEYQEAYKRDELANEKKEKKYQSKLHEARIALHKEYSLLIEDQHCLIDITNNHINERNRAIQSCPIHDSYKNLQTVNWLLYYFEYDLASTMQQAANLMRSDIKMQQFQNLLKKQHAEVISGQKKIIAGQKAIRADLQEYNSELAARWNRLESTLEQQHNEKLAAIQSLEESQKRIAERSRAAISDAQSSINQAIGNLQTQSHSDANYIVQQAREINKK